MHSLLLILFFFPTISSAQDDPTSFLAGVKAYQEKDYTKAQEIFRPILAGNPGNPTTLYNLGLAEYQLGNLGMALGLWRKARFLDHSFVPITQAIAFTEEKLFPDQKESPFFLLIYDWLKNKPVYMWILISLLSFSAAGWFALEYGVKRKVSIGAWPNWIYFSFPIFLFSSFFALSLSLQSLQDKATVIEKNRLTHANPSDTSPTLSELSEGQVVLVEKFHGSWVQVRTLNGAPGWVPQTSLIAFRGN